MLGIEDLTASSWHKTSQFETLTTGQQIDGKPSFSAVHGYGEFVDYAAIVW